MEIKVTLKPLEFYKDSVSILSCVEPYKKMTETQRDIYTELLTRYFVLQYKGSTSEEANRIIFTYDERRRIQDRLRISDSVFRNCLTALRKIGMITGRTLVPKYIPTYGQQIIFNFISKS